MADVPIPSQTAQKQPEAVEPIVPKIEKAQQGVAVISPDIVEIEPIDPDEDFSDIYLGVKDAFFEGKCKVMALKDKNPFFANKI